MAEFQNPQNSSMQSPMPPNGQPMQSQSQMPEEPKKSKAWIWILLLVLVVLGGAGYYFFLMPKVA